jgi:hypothetical protein
LKAVTHYVFSIGVCAYVASYLLGFSILLLLLVLWLSFATNALIDFGHSMRGSTPIRSWVTHSIYTAPVWGGLVGVVSIVVPGYLLNQPPNAMLVLSALGLGVLTALTHLLLDSLTEAGVYNGRRRVALAHVSYDNWILNGAFIAVGILLLAASVAL